ncbi:MAG: hypothetical protein JWM27_1805 [Gemmatimonadetes bacterium]|nr:hypothetical protein [Gemmatimonadota bacterium]
MKKSPAQAPAAQIRLSAYPPAPARIDLQSRPLPGRLALALLVLGACWAPIPWLAALRPRYPWAAIALCLGVYLAQRVWTGRYRVRSFLGVCPRCGRHLRIDAGTAIDLPHTLTCAGCHFEPRLEVDFRLAAARTAPAAGTTVRHLEGECAGSWHEHWHQDEPYLECAACGARHFATPQLRRAAAAENARGDLLARLADEGRFLE